MIDVSKNKEPIVRSQSIIDMERSLNKPDDHFAYAPLAVVACHFNWCNHARPVQNLRRFVRSMELQHGLPVYGIELYVNGQLPATINLPRWKQHRVGKEAMLWQKEPLLNAAAKLVPHEFEFIAALDADIWFSNEEWPILAAECLSDGCPAVQPYSDAVWTHEDGRPQLIRPSCARSGLDRSFHGHPGFAWAFHRDFFNKVGFYKWAALGTGDIVTAAGLLDETLPSSAVSAIGEHNLESGIFDEWRSRAKEYMGDSLPGYFPGSVWHEWHGSLKNRNYAKRAPLMKDCDVLRDLKSNPGGWIEWTHQADKDMIDGTVNYFNSRKEDG